MKLLLDQSNLTEWAIARSVQCHQIARDGHWWTDLATGQPKERNKAEMLALIHSEISEAYMGTGFPDDKLPQFQGDAVEIVDALIRIFDMVGGTNVELDLTKIEVFSKDNPDKTPSFLYSEAHKHVTIILEAIRRNRSVTGLWENLIWWLVYSFSNISYIGQLDTIIDAKLAFNQQREDHKIENRIKADGKKI